MRCLGLYQYKGTFDEMLAGDIRCLEALAYHPAHAHVFCNEEFLLDLIYGVDKQCNEGKVMAMDIENLHRISRLMAYVDVQHDCLCIT